MKSMSQRTELSELFDGELDAERARAFIGIVARDEELRRDWEIYACLGDHLRDERLPETNLVAAVMARLKEEPVVLAPRPLRPQERQHPFLALAASVAGIAVVGWLALSGRPEAVLPAPTFSGQLAAAGKSTMPAAANRARLATPEASAVAAHGEAAALRGEIRELLLAHQMQASSFRLGDSTEHVRTVAATGRAGAP
ncbi:MAG: sigma-E factor negative regulatory protein [Rhodocyclaceae bacterium]|nr:sigma-E factor negative regulatory protein [Rhodocyclaceae bacterium]